jgi:oxalate decarboxylase/phosphoglucose isomerase-like protein (cupin superfamily)
VHEFSAGDTVYIPQNTLHQHINTGDEPLVLLSVQNRLFRSLGYDNVAYLEDAPEYSGAAARETASAGA